MAGHWINFRNPLADLPSLPLRLAGLLLLILLGSDRSASQDLFIPRASLRDVHAGESQLVNLPYIHHSTARGEQYVFAFPLYVFNRLDRYRSLRVIGRDCIEKITVNGVAIPLENQNPWALCNVNGITLGMGEYFSATANFQVTVNAKQGENYGLILHRDPILNLWQTVAVAILACYMLLVPRSADGSALRRFRMVFGIGAAFLSSLVSMNYGHLDTWILISNVNNFIVTATFVFLLFLWAPLREGLRRTGLWMHCISQWPPAVFVSLCCLVFLVLAGTLSQLIFGGLPHITDTQTQYMQAKLFAQGKLYEESHPLSKFFDFPFAVNNGKFYSQYFPGHPLLLALGMLAGAPWLVNPILGALTVAATYLLANEIAGRRAGYIAAILVMISPFIVFMSSEYMNHATTLLFLTLFLFGYIRLLKTGMYRYAAPRRRLCRLCLYHQGADHPAFCPAHRMPCHVAMRKATQKTMAPNDDVGCLLRSVCHAASCV